jgi:glycosyltransferase involved in cell wall biosynthesis
MMAQRPTVSVAMTTYNGMGHIGEQLASILCQSVRPTEIVVADDASTDGTVSYLKQFASRHKEIEVVLILNAANIGLRRNVEAALGRCRSEVVVLCDQDDIWERSKVEFIVNAFRNPEVMLWFSDSDLIDGDGSLLGVSAWQATGFDTVAQAEMRAGDGLDRLMYGQTVTGAAMAVRRDVLAVSLPLPVELDSNDHVFLHDGWLAALAYVLGSSVVAETYLIQATPGSSDGDVHDRRGPAREGSFAIAPAAARRSENKYDREPAVRARN